VSGTEGGFRDDEVEMGRAAGWDNVSPVPRRISVETAALALAPWFSLGHLRTGRMTRLSVNETRSKRNTGTHGPMGFRVSSRWRKFALEAGAQGITVHPRTDQRHIRPADVFEMDELLKD